MKKNIISIIGIMFMLTISLFILTSCSNDESYRIVKIFSYTGNCQVVRDKNTLAVQKDMKLKNNDELQVSASSNAILKLDNDKFVNVKENTNVKLEATGKENKTKTRLHVLNGGVIVEVKEKLKDNEAFEIASSNSVMAIRGTQISFDVEKTTDSITSTFSILKGETEIFLYKDENMDSTSLIHDYMMSYTTSLIKSTDEIYKIYDKGGHKKLTDDELLTKYGVKKTPISNNKINEMVKAVNDFEKEEEEIVNGVLDFTIPTEMAYNTNPIDVINVSDDNRYIDLLDFKYLYSNKIDGTYKEYDNSNPLTVGTWYCKVDAGNAYVSDPIEFSVVKANINFEIGDAVSYKTNPNTIITVDGNYDNLKYLYSSTIDGIYAEYSETNALPTGVYYAKVENDCYTSTPKQFRVTQATISISLLNESVAYKTNPSTIISVSGASGNITYKYGTSRTTINKTYSASSPLTVGTWYVQVSSGTQFTSNILEFEVIPAKLDISLSSDSVEYQENPSTIINVNGTYSNIKFLYSTSETGEFSEFDNDNPLDVGFYYVKVVSGNEYISDILDFEIIPKEITFTLGDSVAYGVNPSTIITITNGTYTNATYLYRKAGSTTDVEFDSSNPFEVGTWYVSIDNGSNYSSSRKSFEVVQAQIDYSLTSTSVEYGTNPNTIIALNGTYPTVTYKYSTTSTGTYTEYDSANPLVVGTYYVKLFINDNYTSTAKQFSVTKKSFDFTIDSEIEYGENILNHITVSSQYTNLSYYYSTSSAFSTQTEITSTTVLAPRTYYVKVYSGTSYESVIKSFEIVKANVDFTLSNTSISLGDDLNNYITDSLDRNIMYSSTATGTYSTYDPADGLSVGTYYIKMENTYYTSDAKQITIVERPFTVSNITMNENYITATIKTLETTGSKTFKVTYYLDKNDPLTTELFNDGDRYYFQVMDLTDSSKVKFKYLYYIDDVLTDETDYYIIDASNLEDLSLGTDFELTESRSAFALHTFNSDGTINLYYDLGFVNNTSYDLVCEVTYGTYSFGEVDVYYSNQKKVFTTSEFLTLTDLAYRSWAVCGIRVLKLIDGIYYVAYSDYDDENYDNDLCRPLFDAKAAANGIYYDYDDYFYEISASFNTVLEVNGIATVIVKVTDDNWDEVIQTIAFTSDDPTRVVNVSCDDLDELYVTISYTRVISIKSDLAQKIFDSSHTSDMKINNASQLEEVIEAMEEKFGITVKGTFSRDYYLETYFEPDQW